MVLNVFCDKIQILHIIIGIISMLNTCIFHILSNIALHITCISFSKSRDFASKVKGCGGSASSSKGSGLANPANRFHKSSMCPMKCLPLP